jgi:hypothetical protein
MRNLGFGMLRFFIMALLQSLNGKLHFTELDMVVTWKLKLKGSFFLTKIKKRKLFLFVKIMCVFMEWMRVKCCCRGLVRCKINSRSEATSNLFWELIKESALLADISGDCLRIMNLNRLSWIWLLSNGGLVFLNVIN